ncbi:MAG TPA: DnaJ domain-containing protein [Mycobacterium sp.]|nr:DnaJ domain-containing protein [Mycobacterium sp.]
MIDPYSVLGVSHSATNAEITHAYRRRLREHHPDLRGDHPTADADERLRQIVDAYALLRDPRRRAAYDRGHPYRRNSGAVQIPVTHHHYAEDRPSGRLRWRR